MQKVPACPKCSGHFIAKESGRLHKRPLVLNCGHTFCESCLLQLAREKKTSILCPSCREETGLVSGESSVRLLCPDRYIMGTVIHNQKTLFEQELNKLKKASEMAGQRQHTSSGCSDSSKLFSEVDSDKLCKECVKRPATSHCAKCDCNMCSVCFQRVHSSSRSLQLHTAIPLTDDGQLEASQMCKEHENRPIEYYCDDDDTNICSRCVIVGNHKGHSISSIEDKNRCIVNEMEPNLQVANHVFRRLKRIDKELPLLVPDYKTEMSGVLENIHTHFQHLHGILQIREHELEQQVLQVAREGLQPLEKLRRDLHNEFKQLDQTIKAAHRIMNNNDEVIVNAKEILEKLAHAKDIPCIIELCESAESTEKIGFIEGTSIDTQLQEYGSISGSVPQRFTMFTLRDKPEKFSEDTESCVTTPSGSVVSEATSQSDDVIIEEEQEIVLEGDGPKSVESVKPVKSTKPVKKSLPQKKKFKGQNELVLVTHIQSPCKFMVQLKRDSSKVAVLSHGLQQFCNSPAAKHHLVTGVDVDDIVLAQYSLDNLWYRGRIKHVIEPDDGNFENTNVEISYFDYGNAEVVNVQRLRNMQAKFMRYPEFSVECCLSNTTAKVKDGTWSVEAVQTFAKMVEGKVMLLTIVNEVNNVMHVDLGKPADDDIVDDRPMSVRDALVFLDLARFESPNSLPEPGGAPAPKRNYLTPAPKEEGETYCVIVTYAGTPDCFYAQELGDETSYLATMMAHIQDTYNKQMKDTWQIICPSVGMICVSQFTGDGLWYRAKIVDLPGHQEVVVQYVDYGNKETVHVFNLRKIIDSFLVLPAQAIQCTLTDVEPLNANEGWTTECLHYWSEKVLMKKFFLKVVKSNHELSVVLRDIDTEDNCDSLNVKVIEDNMARSVGQWSEPQNVTELANEMSDFVPRLSYQAGGGSFPEPCDLGHQPVYWKSRNTKPSRRYEETVLTPPNSPERQAQPQTKQVKPKQQGHVEKSTVAQALLQNSQSAQRIAAEKKSSPVKKSPNASPKKVPASPVKKVQDTCSDASSVSSAVTDAERHADIVENVSPKKSPGAKSKIRGEKGSAEKKKSKKIEVEVTVSHFISPSEFYLQLVGSKEELAELMSCIDETYHNSVMSMTNWTAGNYCVAYSSQTGRWYRAKITKVIQKSLMEVHMLDYGFSEMISTNNLRQVMKQYRKNRAFTFACKLAGVTPAGGMKEWSKTACEFMEANINNKKIFLNQRGNPVDGKLLCDLIIEEYIDETALEPGRKTYHSLIDRLKEKGLAIPVPKKHAEVHDKQKVFPVCYYKKAEAEVKTGDKVMPVYVDYDAVIHCYTMEGDDIFQSMCDTLHQKFNNSEAPGPEQTYQKGQACAAFYEKDGQWHRATVLEIEPTKIKINFIDYGNSEWVAHEDLRADIAEFTDIPQQTFLCTLHDVKPVTENGKWDLNSLEMMHKDLVNKYCIITVMEKNGYENDHMTVNLEVNGKDYGTHLVHYGMAQRGDYITDQEMQSAQIEHILQKNPFKTMPLPAAGEMLSVLVTHVELPNIVYVQPSKVEVTDDMDVDDAHKKKILTRNKQLAKLEKLSTDLYHAAPTLPAIPVPHIGLACCAQFGYDQCWYRAVIISVYQETQQILVLFVDYGNSEIITYNKLRAIPPSYLNLPCQALRCALSRLQPAANTVSWTRNSLVEMMSVVANKPLLAKLVKRDPVVMELFEGSEDDGFVYQSVIDGGYIQLDTGDTPVASPTVKEVVTVTQTMEMDIPKVVVTKAPKVNVKSDSESESLNDSVKDSAVNNEANPPENVLATETEEKKVEGKVNVDIGARISEITIDSTTDEDRSESSSVSVATVSTTTTEIVSKSSKSWAEMADEGSSIDIDEVLEFEDSEISSASELDQKKGESEQDRKRSQKEKKKLKPEDRKKTRDSRKVEAVQHEDECFE